MLLEELEDAREVVVAERFEIGFLLNLEEVVKRVRGEVREIRLCVDAARLGRRSREYDLSNQDDRHAFLGARMQGVEFEDTE